VVDVKNFNTLTFSGKKIRLALYFVEMDPDQQDRDANSGSAKMMPIRPHPEFVTAWQCEIYSAIILGEKLETNYLPE
jgi:hypothetical protein